MIGIGLLSRIKSGWDRSGPRLGTRGHLMVFAWSLTLILLAPAERFLVAIGFGLVVNAILYPIALRRLLHWRWLILACLLIFPNLLWVGPADNLFWGVPLSLHGLQIGLQMASRAMVVLIAVEGFSSSVDICEVAGFFERAGFPGMGFSMGVAVNLLPSLRKSGSCAWHALLMRGGLRRQWWRGLRLLLVTVMVNALRRAEGIALAAEARAYSPGRSQAQPMKRGALDLPIATALLFGWIVLILVR